MSVYIYTYLCLCVCVCFFLVKFGFCLNYYMSRCRCLPQTLISRFSWTLIETCFLKWSSLRLQATIRYFFSRQTWSKLVSAIPWSNRIFLYYIPFRNNSSFNNFQESTFIPNTFITCLACLFELQSEYFSVLTRQSVDRACCYLNATWTNRNVLVEKSVPNWLCFCKEHFAMTHRSYFFSKHSFKPINGITHVLSASFSTNLFV